MCGIVGSTGHSISEQAVRAAVDSMRHRGPDGSGIFIDPESPVALGHARLSIIDPATGAQPLYSEDEDIVLVCNGEIYDFERLREELILEGHEFRTGSDSEVIIHLYQQYGLAFVAHLRGEFAFLLYDRRERKLLAVRDRFGIKPLFFNDQGGRLLFASEAKAMTATGLLAPRLSIEAIRDFFSMVIPDSMFEGVEAVPPGCMLIANLRDGTHEIRRYWDCDLPPEDDESEETDFGRCLAMLREKFDEAVRFRLRADVPVGVYLSAGIDSAIVAATAAKYHHEKVMAFNISFPEDEAFDESRMAREMAAKIGAEFHSVECGPETLVENAEDCIWVTELPFHNFHGVGKFVLSRLARKYVKVILTGEGADEVFLGYVHFQPGKGALIDQMIDKLKAQQTPGSPQGADMLETLGFVPMPDYVYMLSPRTQKLILSVFHRKHRPRLKARRPVQRLRERIDRDQTEGRPPVRRMQYAWIKNMLAPYLLTILGDRPELAHSIEGRTPFLDHHLFEAARHIPDRFKICGGVEKHVLREAFKERVTEAIYSRKKWPYSAPPVWIEKGRHPGLDALLDKYLSREAIEESGIFRYRQINAWRWFLKLLFFDCLFKRRLNGALAFILTVQILDRLFVRNFEEKLNRPNGSLL
ncbi:MAG TPA: asparagine synthase (glutamine-hydrolyzing) [Syntrophobacteraceae bacterium]|nr:asparagine synthase (glutamine-hydrolyzing) [Syntrophobacteraceae bacterium]